MNLQFSSSLNMLFFKPSQLKSQLKASYNFNINSLYCDILTAFIECMSDLLVESGVSHIDSENEVSQSSIVGLRTITKNVMKNTVLTNDELSEVFAYSFRYYNGMLYYMDNLPYNNRDIEKFIGKYNNIVFDREGKNMLMYLVLVFYNDMVSKSVKLVKFSGKKTLNGNSLKFSFDDYPEGLRTKLDIMYERFSTMEISDNNSEEGEEVEVVMEAQEDNEPEPETETQEDNEPEAETESETKEETKKEESSKKKKKKKSKKEEVIVEDA